MCWVEEGQAVKLRDAKAARMAATLLLLLLVVVVVVTVMTLSCSACWTCWPRKKRSWLLATPIRVLARVFLHRLFPPGATTPLLFTGEEQGCLPLG
jgi:uncharacterized membrane protein YqjE